MDRKLNYLHLAAVIVGSTCAGLVLKARFGTDWFEFAGFVTGVVGVYLVAVEHIINWPIGIANVSIYAWVFFTSRLYADMSLQFFFFALSLHGWWKWARGGEGKATLLISKVSLSHWVGILLTWMLGTAIYLPIILHFNGAAPFIDSSLTVASIIAQLMLNLKKLENWILWIGVDTAYIYLYVSRGLVATAVLYALLLGLAVAGLNSWNRTYRTLSKPISGS